MLSIDGSIVRHVRRNKNKKWMEPGPPEKQTNTQGYLCVLRHGLNGEKGVKGAEGKRIRESERSG